ncbi:MAG: nicotinamide-nucleotide adenylyltransferase [Candidatus Aenigmatarchaeota archaeon]|nr:MAG: nicotinamide-nucleotide adenylyltransferase [Candidatus Aenigmarchaeota archaeon]
MSDALFVGRFQPFHKGHLMVIRDIAKKHGKVIIIIGSADKSGTSDNPFNVAERMEMIEKVLAKENISYEIYAVKDFNDCKKWVEAIKKLCKFDVVYSRNPWTIRCFEEAGIKVIRHKFYERYIISGTNIREMMKSGEDWQKYVPKEVYEYVKSKGIK